MEKIRVKTRRQRKLIRARERSGRPKRSGAERHKEPEVNPTLNRRLIEAAHRGLRDPIWATELGRLHLERKIDQAQFQAGTRWAQDLSTYRQAIGIIDMRTVTLERGRKTGDVDPDSDRGRAQADHDYEAMQRFYKAYQSLMEMGTAVERSLDRLCAHNLSLGSYDDMRAAKMGLSALAVHYGYYRLTSVEKSTQYPHKLAFRQTGNNTPRSANSPP